MEQKIKTIIRQVGDIGEKLSQLPSEESLPSIEKDIILSEIRILYEAVKNLQVSPVKIPSVEEEKKTETVVKKEPDVKAAEPAILADKYKENNNFINESFAGNMQDVSSKIQSTPIRNISSALGINDRFKLIHDLFNGDKNSYHNAIGILDRSSNFNEAFNYITSSFDWDMEGDSVQLLLELVRRKFIVNKNE